MGNRYTGAEFGAPIQVRLPPDLAKRARKVARAGKATLSELIRRALEAYVSQAGAEAGREVTTSK